MLNIKEVEKLTNITKQNIRYYERQGLINQNSTETGYANRRDSEIITS